MNKHFLNSIWLGIGLTAFTYAIGLAFGWINTVNPLEVFAVATSYSCTWLCTVQSRINYLVGVVTTAAYSLLFWQSGAPALALFNLYLVFSMAYGWVRWRSDENTRPVTRTYTAGWVFYGLFGVVVLTLYLWVCVLFGMTLADMNKIDIGLAVVSGIAQLMLDNKKLENWAVWAGINVVSIPYFWSLGLPLAAFQYVFFIINTRLGHVAWKKSMN